MARLCIITGFHREAACIDTRESDGNILVLPAGTDFRRAAAQAQPFIAAGCDGVMSFGIAGALKTGLEPGDIVLPNRIINGAGDSYSVDERWQNSIHHRLSAGREAVAPIHTGHLFGSDVMVGTPGAKTELGTASGAIAVDMESHAAASLARDNGASFLALRVIADTADQSIPKVAEGAIGGGGEIRVRRLLGNLAFRPWQISDLISLGRGYRRAMASLRRVAALDGPEFGLGDFLD